MPEFVPMPEGEQKCSLAAVLGQGEFYCRIDAPSSIEGYFLQKVASGIRFLKVVPSAHAERQLAANAVAEWVVTCGGRASLLLPGFPKQLAEGHVVLAYQYIPSRFAEATIADLEVIGSSLAHVHAALARMPNRGAVMAASAKRVAMLNKRFQSVRSGDLLYGPRPQLMRDIFEADASLFALLGDSAGRQPLHGDLVYANLMFPLGGGGLVMLDFEDTLVSWLPIDLDVALALERFALLPARTEADALRLVQAMLQKYGEGCGKARFLAHAPADCLRLLAIRSLATLSELEAVGTHVEPSEWEKFFGLYQNAVDKYALLSRLRDQFCV
jgi:hypothetical protein